MCREGSLSMDSGTQSFQFSQWMESSHTMSFQVLSLPLALSNFSESWSFCLPTHTLVLEVSLFWKIVAFITQRRSGHLLRTKHSANLSSCRLTNSPDLNPIEQAFSCIKAHLCRFWQDFSLSIIDHACQHITLNMARSFFKASGYVV